MDSHRYSEEKREEILRVYKERASLQGLNRVYGVAITTVLAWLKKANSLGCFIGTLLPAKVNDIVEFDEQWSFVLCKETQYWLWIALCRRTMQVVAYYLGERTVESFNEFYAKIPPQYAACLSQSDKWQGYKRINSWSHKRCLKKEGETNCVEGFNNILRQRVGRLVRKSCAFSKSKGMHENVLKVFLYEYNNELNSVKQ